MRGFCYEKTMVLLIAALTVALCICGNNKTSESKGLKDIAVQADYTRYEYAQLRQVSDVIAKAEALDELSEKNSIILKDSDDPEAVSAVSSVREKKYLTYTPARGKQSRERP